MRLGVLTSGGDCPGLNAVIRAVVRKVERGLDGTVLGFLDGYVGLMEDRYEVLTVESCRGLLPRGGTILGTSRHQPYGVDGGLDMVRRTMTKRGLDGLVVIGGNGSLAAGRDLHDDGIGVVGVPKTIDNDLGATEVTFGFDTAVATATEAIDRLHTTAESHDRVMLVEVMGRHVGHIATWAGIAGGASMILVPEEPFDLDEVCAALVRRHHAGRFASIVVVAEGAVPVEGSFTLPEPGVDEFGHQRLGGIAHVLAPEIERRTGFETKVVVLGYVQRGGSPTAADRVLGDPLRRRGRRRRRRRRLGDDGGPPGREHRARAAGRRGVHPQAGGPGAPRRREDLLRLIPVSGPHRPQAGAMLW